MNNGGAENMLADIINIQVKTENVYLLIINKVFDSNILSRIDKKCTIFFLNREIKSKSPFVFLRLNWIIFKGHYNIIHLHQNTVIRKIFIPCNYVRTVHNTHQTFHDYRWHKKIIAISESVKKELDYLGYKNVVLINNGINFELIDNCQKVESQIKVFRMVQVSRVLFRQKGQDLLVKAIKKVVLLNSCYKIHLDFIGDGPDLEKLKLMVNEYKLNNVISIFGDKSREYIYKNLCNYDLFIQPSRFEGFGLTVVEAMAAKVPVLVSDNEGPLQIIKNGEYGFYFKNGNIDDAAIKISEIIKRYPNKEFIDKAYQHVKNNYSIKNTAISYLAEYRKVLNIKNIKI